MRKGALAFTASSGCRASNGIGQMQGVRLDHATLRSAKVAETVAFYARFLGLKPGWRPSLGVDGVWLYPEDGDYPIVHIIETNEQLPPGGMFDHFALRGDDLLGYLKLLSDAAVSFEARPVPETQWTQVHHFDPNGVKVEVTFDELAAAEDLVCALPYPPR